MAKDSLVLTNSQLGPFNRLTERDLHSLPNISTTGIITRAAFRLIIKFEEFIELVPRLLTKLLLGFFPVLRCFPEVLLTGRGFILIAVDVGAFVTTVEILEIVFFVLIVREDACLSGLLFSRVVVSEVGTTHHSLTQTHFLVVCGPFVVVTESFVSGLGLLELLAGGGIRIHIRVVLLGHRKVSFLYVRGSCLRFDS